MAADALLVGMTSQGASPIVSVAGTTSASGSSFLAVVVFDSGSTLTGVADSKSNAYSQIGSTIAGGGVSIALYKSENGTGGASHTCTATFTGTPSGTVYFIELTGCSATPTDTGSFASVADTTDPYTVTTGTFAQANNIVIAVGGSSSGTNPNNWTPNTGTLVSSEVNGSLFWTSGVSKQYITATTAITPSFSALSGQVIVAVGFKEASAGGSPATYQPLQYQRKTLYFI